jgi:hypothetical protein
LFFVHLKKGLSVFPLDWINCQDPTPLPAARRATAYGVDTEAERDLAAIRTDLDSFTEVEGHSLMASGYLVTEHEIKELQKQHEESGEPGNGGGFDVHAPRGDWPFLQLEAIVGQPPGSPDPRRKDLGLQLAVASRRVFKVWRLYPGLRWLSRAGLALAALVLLWLILKCWNSPLVNTPITIGNVFLFLLVTAAGLLVPALKWVSPEQATRGILRRAALALLGYLGAGLHLSVFDCLFLKRGTLKRLLDLQRDR